MIRKVSESLFPGKGSFREIVVEYDMPYAEGAGLFDKRKTQSNTYLLSESSQDLNMTVENLADAEDNEYYSETNGIVIGVKGGSGETYLVYVNDVNVLNRFDVGRLKRTILKLTEKLQEATYNVASKP
jgi:hypothetical protein